MFDVALCSLRKFMPYEKRLSFHCNIFEPYSNFSKRSLEFRFYIAENVALFLCRRRRSRAFFDCAGIPKVSVFSVQWEDGLKIASVVPICYDKSLKEETPSFFLIACKNITKLPLQHRQPHQETLRGRWKWVLIARRALTLCNNVHRANALLVLSALWNVEYPKYFLLQMETA